MVIEVRIMITFSGVVGFWMLVMLFCYLFVTKV